MMKVINQFDTEPIKGYFDNTVSVFLAGGISNTKKEWQLDVIKELEKLDELKLGTLIVYNPRRFTETSKTKELGKDINNIIKWDIDAMDNSNIISVYFTNDTGQSSSLFELGMYLAKAIQIFGNRSYLHLCVSIEEGYSHSKKLIAYLKYILKDDFDLICDTENVTPKTHANHIYRMYTKILADKIS